MEKALRGRAARPSETENLSQPYVLAPSLQRLRCNLDRDEGCSHLEDALAETLAWYRVGHPSHPGYANRAQELEIAGAGS